MPAKRSRILVMAALMLAPLETVHGQKPYVFPKTAEELGLSLSPAAPDGEQKYSSRPVSWL